MLDAEALYSRAFKAYRGGDKSGAEADLEAALALSPRDPRAELLKGVVHDKGDGPVGLALVEDAVHRDPGNAEAWYNLGVFHSERGQMAEALAAYERAAALDPTHIDTLNNGCELLRRFDRFETAMTWADRQLQLGAKSWAAHLNRAVCLLHLRRFDEAEAAFQAALAIDPTRPIVRWEQFPMFLHQERFAEAWAAFEDRFACGHLNGVHHYPFPQPLWRGEPLAGRHILIHNEQGLGDQLMFASALGEVVAEAKNVSLVAAPELVALFKASFPTVQVLPARFGRFAGDHPVPDWIAQVADADYQLPIGGLMHRLRTSPESFANPGKYLRPSDAARARWPAPAKPTAVRVGVCWASNPALFRHDSSRRAVKKSMALETLAPLADVKGVELISVLNWRVDPMPAALQGKLRDVFADLKCLDDTAALIETLDVVITVDTAVAHLAGALGKRTWMLLHDYADCRWGLTPDHSYWYADMRLFRQTVAGDWDSVVAEVVAELAREAQASAAT